MKRAVILVVAISMILTGCFMEPNSTNTEISAGSHYLKGQVIALEACYSNATDVGSTCVGVVDNNGQKRAGRVMGDIRIGSNVYKECTISERGNTCSNVWKTSVGEGYLKGGEIVNL
ncbi:hypothetical protein OBP_202 [Pseudomonas phage OBP]|uniref:membrane protein n=1 Tax=Pseudomonas phage OBP TaxID=1124849 RepID=UPI000240D5AA|nr:membrane protein [Pseudomonas phage OBP]AEV89639.1 hypothetical protein OBP_202 [Pseudomonas phage OBP]